jgi:hypothetical protein
MHTYISPLMTWQNSHATNHVKRTQASKVKRRAQQRSLAAALTAWQTAPEQKRRKFMPSMPRAEATEKAHKATLSDDSRIFSLRFPLNIPFSQELREMITNTTGMATMFDTRRTEVYDPTKARLSVHAQQTCQRRLLLRKSYKSEKWKRRAPWWSSTDCTRS